MRDSRFLGDLRRFRKINRKYERLCTKYDKYITIYFEKVGRSSAIYEVCVILLPVFLPSTDCK